MNIILLDAFMWTLFQLSTPSILMSRSPSNQKSLSENPLGGVEWSIISMHVRCFALVLLLFFLLFFIIGSDMSDRKTKRHFCAFYRKQKD
jgi:hypothetical protein